MYICSTITLNTSCKKDESHPEYSVSSALRKVIRYDSSQVNANSSKY